MSTRVRIWGCLVTLLLAALNASAAATPESGLLLDLPLRTDLADHSKSARKVKVVKQVEIRDGAAWFSGKDSWLELPHIAFNRRAFSFAMWVKPTGDKPMYGLIDQKDENIVNSWLHLMLRGGRQPYLGFYNNDLISPVPVEPSAWVHLVFQYDGKRQLIWINGQLVCARRCEPYAGNRGVTRIGRSPRWTNVPSYDFEGFMRDIKLYDRALTATEIARLATPGPDMGRAAKVVPTKGAISPEKPPAVAATAKPGGPTMAETGETTVPFLSIEGRTLVITGDIGQIYELQYSTNLFGQWQAMTTLTNATGRVEYTDENAGRTPQCFYRISTR